MSPVISHSSAKIILLQPTSQTRASISRCLSLPLSSPPSTDMCRFKAGRRHQGVDGSARAGAVADSLKYVRDSNTTSSTVQTAEHGRGERSQAEPSCSD